MGIIRDSFVIYRDWAEGISELSPKNRLACYDALMQFGLTGQFPEDIKNETVRALLKSFKREMQNNIARYMASVENGKKGGRPKKNQEIEENQDDLDKTQENLEKPRKTQENLSEPTHNLNVNDNVNVYVNDNKLDKKEEIIENKNKNACVCVRERFSSFFNYHKNNKFSDKAKLIIDVLEELEQKDNFKFKGKVYTNEQLRQRINSFKQEQFEKLISCMAFSEDIENEPLYITATILS